MGKRKAPNSDLLVQARDTYDPTEYILVHEKYFDGMRAAIKEAHVRLNGAPCICIYCRHGETAALSAPAEPK